MAIEYEHIDFSGRRNLRRYPRLAGNVRAKDLGYLGEEAIIRGTCEAEELDNVRALWQTAALITHTLPNPRPGGGGAPVTFTFRVVDGRVTWDHGFWIEFSLSCYVEDQT